MLLQVDPSTSSAAPSTKNAPSSKPMSSAAVARAQINEDSPTIKQILAASGCASVAELLARDQQKATSGSKAATNASTRASATNVSKSSAMNRSKSATNGAKVSKSTNGSKATANPKKKAKRKLY